MRHARATGLVIAILIAAMAAGFGAYEWLQPIHTPATPAAERSTPDNTPSMSPDQAMQIGLDDLKGISHKLADWRGKVLLINFWATWCLPCRQEIPLLVKLQAKYAAQGLQVVGIATDEQDEKDVRSFIKHMVVNYPILMGDNQAPLIIEALGGHYIGLPYSVVLDQGGRVFKIHAGELDPKEAETLVRTAIGNMALTAPVPVTTSHAN